MWTRRTTKTIKVLAIILSVIASLGCHQASDHKSATGDAELFLTFFSRDRDEFDQAIKTISENWKASFIPMALETIYLSRNDDLSFELMTILQQRTGQKFGYEFNDWYQWLWNQPESLSPDYAVFKAGLYKLIDRRFEKYFLDRQEQSRIRLDEVRWGGVRQDGIPPLRQPNMIPADQAGYLEDDNIVFGIEVNGDVRAYPKRILAWHEMFADHVGGIPVAGVYCTLCGTMILYKTEFGGINHQLGTSGFLYRSNKLMYDKATQSLWNTILGQPVIGPLADKGIELEVMSVVTTTWGEWKSMHPNTQVLSLLTGHQRNYDEGVAYRDYFSTDELMFNTPFDDRRLKNKDEVLAIRLPSYPDEQLGISAKFLRRQPIYTDKLGDTDFVVLTDQGGGNRVYETQGVSFEKYDRGSVVTDSNGLKWVLKESQLVAEDGRILPRLPYHRAFWFGWVAAFPNTRLVK